ncbi:MAG: hypothetical protein FWE42_00935 [Defluviitaleaceae bacterium]|nr:hypothetical protein [Defluviitaleaceae bacterium]
MNLTEKYKETTNEVINLLAKKGYTVSEACSVLRHISSEISAFASVQPIPAHIPEAEAKSWT